MRRALLLFVALVLVPRAAWTQAGMPLGPEFRVNTYTTNVQSNASAAWQNGGDFVVVWSSNLQDGSITGIFGQRYAGSGAPLGSEFRINTFTTLNQDSPDVSVDTAGTFVVVWQSYLQDGSLMGVFGQRYNGSGVPLGTEFRVNTYTTSDQALPSVASRDVGHFVIVWQDYTQDGSGWGVFGQRYDLAGTPVGPEFRVNTHTTNIQFAPAVDIDILGNFVVVWQSQAQDGSGLGVFGQRFASTGAPLGPEFRVNTYTPGFQHYPSVASDAAGNFVVAWHSLAQDGSGDGIFAQRYAAIGTPLGPEFRVNTYTTGAQYLSSVAADNAGNFVIVWNSGDQDGSNLGVFGQRYASSGVPQGPEFRVNTFTTLAQTRAAAAAEPGLGNFVVVWDSQLQDGSVLGVFGQRFGQIVPVELMRFEVE